MKMKNELHLYVSHTLLRKALHTSVFVLMPFGNWWNYVIR